jgi:hypothetical protein
MADGIVVLDKSQIQNGQAPRDVGAPSPQTGIQKESWDGIYRDYRDTPIHQVLSDCYTGIGGLKGSSASGEYSYLTPFKSELQWLTRLSITEYVNYMRRFVNVRIDPIYTGVTLHNKITLGGEEYGGEAYGFAEWLSAVDGVNKDYNSFQRTFSRWNLTNDVAYAIMDKNKVNKIVMFYRRAIDVIGEPVTDWDTNELNSIWFYDRKVLQKDGTYKIYSTLWEMKDGYQWRVTKSAYLNPAYNTVQQDWKNISKVNTGSQTPLVFASVIGDHDSGCYLPDQTKSYDVARLSLRIYNMMSNIFWLLVLQGHSILFVHGKISGLSASQSILNLPVSADGSSVPNPDFISPDAELPRVHIETLNFVLKQLFDIMKEFGVSVSEGSTSQAQSGESKSYDFQATNNAILSTVENVLVPLDRWVIQTYLHLNGVPLENIKQYGFERSYPNDFFPTPEDALVDLIDSAESAKSNGFLTLSAQIWGKIARKILKGDLTPELYKELLEEVTRNIEEDYTDESIATDTPTDNKETP